MTISYDQTGIYLKNLQLIPNDYFKFDREKQLQSLSDPQTLFEQNCATISLLIESQSNPDFQENEFILHLLKNKPFAFFIDCYTASCPCSRKQEVGRQKRQEMIDQLIPLFQNQTQFTYVTYLPGHLLWDLLFLTQLILTNRQLQKIRFDVVINGDINLNDLPPTQNTFDLSEIKINTITLLLSIIIKYWLQHLNPNLQVEVNIYISIIYYVLDHLNHHLDYQVVEQCPVTKTIDLIIAIDIEARSSIEHYCLIEFVRVIVNRSTKVAWLRKSYKEHFVESAIIRSDHLCDSNLEHDSLNQLLSMYLTDQAQELLNKYPILRDHLTLISMLVIINNKEEAEFLGLLHVGREHFKEYDKLVKESAKIYYQIFRPRESACIIT